MRLKLLLLVLMLSGGLFAQDTIRSLVITEVRLDDREANYIELTNMGDEAINLSQFKLGTIRPWNQAINNVFTDPWIPDNNRFIMLPDVNLQPGESYVVASAVDFAPRQYAKKIPGFEQEAMKPRNSQMYAIADQLIHMAEPKGDATDSVSRVNGVDISWMFENWGGRECMYIEQHLSDVDSVVIDQVGGVFDVEGQNNTAGDYDVAGVTAATGNAVLVRKFSVKKGNLDFANARGVGADDSEWIPLAWAEGTSDYRDLWWTVGNHGDYKLDENTLESDVFDVDFANKTITVPWGTRREDGIMRMMKKKPGVAWVYNLNANYGDSLSYAAHTGDVLTVIVCGAEGYKADFDIIVAEPTADVNVIVPRNFLSYPATANQNWREQTQYGVPGGWNGWGWVTEHASGPDTITGNMFGLPYATSVDSLLKKLDKPSNAMWEIIPADGTARPEVRNGDLLRVTAQSGAVKDYFLQVQPLNPSHNADLLSITWPDIPEHYRGLFGWVGDTIPGFNSTTYNYRVTVPLDVDGIPALVAKTNNLNATVQVKRAASLYGTTEQRTISFMVTAEDDSVMNTYNVELIKEKNPANVQPFFAEPFLSEMVFWDQWSNSFGEIANPGNQPLDLSNYMIACAWIYDPSEVIASRAGVDEWLDRYDKYVPGYKWVDEAQWAVTPAVLEQDLNVNAIVYPGDVFAFGGIWQDNQTHPDWAPDFHWQVPHQLDIQFNNWAGTNSQYYPNGYSNPWGEAISGNGSPVRKWSNNQWYMFKILNDSIKMGLKPATDPNDFELIEVFGMGENTDWVIGGKKAEMITNWIRKPGIYKGNPEVKGSFGTDPETSEWTYTNQAYWNARNAGWPYEILNVANDIGQHFMYEPSHYKSTVSSTVYKVSEGYSMNESIAGAKTGTTVATFLGGITKANEMQSLSVMRGDAEVAAGEVLLNNDALVVLSADSTNTTKYMLLVTDEGLSSNAVLTTNNPNYTITIEQQPKSAGNEDAGVGNIKGFDYGTALRTIIANIKVPAGATMTVVDGQGAYVPLKTLSFDTSYVNVTVNDNIYLDVIAENGVTEIVYQLLPSSSENDAFVQSDIYKVVQKDVLIEYVPRGTTVSTLLSNLVASSGATMKVVNKMGQERMDGGVADDDKVVVTSRNGKVSKTYFISKLASEATPETRYLAYILSSSYPIDQVIYKVDGVSGDETVANFLSKVTPAAGATAMVVDKDGMDKTSGDIDRDDKVKVTSADGKIMVYYTFGQLVSSRIVNDENIELYPNPTNGEINISGLKAGYRIQIYNSVGSAIRDINVQNSIERISLRNQPAGMYMVVISDNNKMIGRYKALKQ
jgi:hypothetical protein